MGGFKVTGSPERSLSQLLAVIQNTSHEWGLAKPNGTYIWEAPYYWM
jgi:hypothetical protein